MLVSIDIPQRYEFPYKKYTRLLILCGLGLGYIPALMIHISTNGSKSVLSNWLLIILLTIPIGILIDKIMIMRQFPELATINFKTNKRTYLLEHPTVRDLRNQGWKIYWGETP